MEPKIVYNVFHLAYWDWRVVMDLFLGGLGIGAFLYAIFLNNYKKDAAPVLVKTGSVIAPLAVAGGILFLFMELGHPLRIWKTLVYFNATSMISWGGLLQQAFFFSALVFAYLVLADKSELIRKKMGIVAAFFAVTVGLYHSFLLSFITARPFWNAGAGGLVMLFSSISTGIAAVLLIGSFTKSGRKELEAVSGETGVILVSLLFLQIVAVIVWIVALANGRVDFVNALHCLNKDFSLEFWGGAIVLGLLAPLLLLILGKDAKFPVFLTAVLILAGGFLLRYVLILCGQIS